jgi:hypothetical protein
MSNEIVIEVRSTKTDRQRGFRDKQYADQGAAIYNGGDYPLPIKVNVEVGHEYQPGQYTIDPRSFTCDEHGNLKVKSLRLLPLGGSSKPTTK